MDIEVVDVLPAEVVEPVLVVEVLVSEGVVVVVVVVMEVLEEYEDSDILVCLGWFIECWNSDWCFGLIGQK